MTTGSTGARDQGQSYSPNVRLRTAVDTQLSKMALALIITAIILLLFYIHHKVSTKFSYWKQKGVKGPKPNRIFGNLVDITWNRKYSALTFADKIYKEYPEEKVVGIYQAYSPTLVVRDPEIMRTILIKDFASFVNRGIRVSNEPISRHLFAIDGDDWKMLRQKLTPIFTTGKLKVMMPLMNTCVEKYMEYLDHIVDGVTPREVRRLNMKYTMKSITSVAFGLDVDTYVEETTEFEKMATKIFQISGRRMVIFLLNNLFPGSIDFLHIPIQPEVSNFFLKLVKQVVHEREGKPKVRKDFMDLLIELKEQGTVTRVKDEGAVELEMTIELITAQAIVFYAAGFETSSGAMSFLMYELALNPKVQVRCQEEIDKVMKKYNGKLEYDALQELEYVSMALDESLRKYPVAGALFRQAVTDYTFADLKLTIDKGTKIWMPIMSIHNDPNYYPDPENFEPERFSPENKESLHHIYMPFGDGPRNCIGLRFARVQAMLGIAHFLHKFKVSPCDKTVKKIRFDPRQVTLSSADGIWLIIEKRKS